MRYLKDWILGAWTPGTPPLGDAAARRVMEQLLADTPDPLDVAPPSPAARFDAPLRNRLYEAARDRIRNGDITLHTGGMVRLHVTSTWPFTAASEIYPTSIRGGFQAMASAYPFDPFDLQEYSYGAQPEFPMEDRPRTILRFRDPKEGPTPKRKPEPPAPPPDGRMFLE